jgi:hypothetical protein
MESQSEPRSGEVLCAECQTPVGTDYEVTESGAFCRRCFDALTQQLQEAIAAQGANINYPLAAIGALLGGALGVAIWWGFTVATKIAFGLVAIVIGIGVGKGAILFSGKKRSLGLQMMSVVIAAASFFYASYLVNRTFLTRALAEEGQGVALPLITNIGLMYEVIALDFGLFDVVFLAIVLWEAWKLPAPFKLTR